MCKQSSCFINPINPVIAVFSILKSLILNVLGAGGTWALAGIIESYSKSLNLAHVFRPIYYVSIAFLFVWQLFDWTIFSAKSYSQDATLADTALDHAAVANKYPIHYMWDGIKVAAQSCIQRSNRTQAVDLEQQTVPSNRTTF